jgi:beta-1,4-mannosyltransferase
LISGKTTGTKTMPKDQSRGIRVLMSARRPRPRTNPYVTQLLSSLASQNVEAAPWTWRRALLRSYDIVHLQWPEYLVRNRFWLFRTLNRLGALAYLAKLSLRSVAVVETVHNKSPHESPSAFETWFMKRLRRHVVARIFIAADAEAGPRDATIMHGHYIDWYPMTGQSMEPAASSACFVGIIRDYKQVPRLVQEFGKIEDPFVRLTVAGQPHSKALAEGVSTARGGDQRVTLLLRFLEDSEIVDVIRGASIVILPYREMYNSGAVLLALSLSRPVLVPRSMTTQALATEMGAEWVRLYDGELTSERISHELKKQPLPADTRPDLRSRDWTVSAVAHSKLYRSLLGQSETSPVTRAPRSNRFISRDSPEMR